MAFDKSKFSQGGAPAGSSAAAPAKKGFFAGTDVEAPRFPQLPPGRHELEIVETRRGRGPTFIADVKIVGGGDEKYAYVQSMKDEFGKGARKVFTFVCVAVGADAAGVEQIRAEANEERSIVDAACGIATEYGENPLAGMHVIAHVALGKEDGNGGHYCDVIFEPAA